MSKAQDCFPEGNHGKMVGKIAGRGVEVVWRCCWVLGAGRRRGGGAVGWGKQVAGV